MLGDGAGARGQKQEDKKHRLAHRDPFKRLSMQKRQYRSPGWRG
jgi:hypothetical protein